MSFKELHVLCLAPQHWGHTHTTTTPFFFNVAPTFFFNVAPGDCTQVLLLTQHALCVPCHHPPPHVIFSHYKFLTLVSDFLGPSVLRGAQ